MATKDLQTLIDTASVVRREIDEEMPIQQLATLLTVAMNPGITIGEVASKLDYTHAAASRHAAVLSKIGAGTKEGRNLIAYEEHPSDRRQKILTLTAKGKRVVELLDKTIERR
jgi:DNA-binding MarR family transcriptional regulator